MAKSKKVRMPIGMRNKLMAAVSMLLVSSIMMVSTTFAWFTLSTAPEVTGITTSVGANGNLEMALLNGVVSTEEGHVYAATDTFNDPTKIASAVGDSSATGNTTASNITWGNLVDLSYANYGLNTINLQPARLNVAADAQTRIAAVANLLKTPVYGKDGRVAEVSGTTYASGTFNAGAWGYDAANLTYGVRAIGANDNLTPQQAGLLAAKAAYNTNLNSAKAAIQNGLSTNGSALASAITTMAMNSTDVTLTGEQQTAITNMVTASRNALTYIDAAYKQVLLAGVSTLDATPYAAAVAAINGAADYNAAVTALSTLAGGAVVNPPAFMSTVATALDTQKAAVAAAATALEISDYKTALSKLVDTEKVTVNGYEVHDSNSNASDDLMDTNGNINSTFMNAVLNAGGAIVEMPDGSGVFAYVGSVAGNYSAGCKVSIDYKGLVLNDMNATMKTTATVNTAIGTGLSAITANGVGDGTTSLSDTYGYALDFAFRTNAANSYLQLQTAAAQRVYTDSDSAATQGGGSTMTFAAVKSDTGVPVLTDAQVQKLMGAIRVAFINPDNGDIYGIASLDNIVAGGTGFKGELTLKNYAVEPTTGVMSLTPKTDDSETTDKNEAITLMQLAQSTAAKLTAVVWLDGDTVDNSDVANAAQSLTGSMNLQFSSSAKLQPMKNTALETMTIKYTEETSEYFQFNGVMYKRNAGYKVYSGSDSMTYYSNDEGATYTRVGSLNVAEVGSPVTGKVSGGSSVKATETIDLTASLENATVKNVAWSSSPISVATVAGSGANNTTGTVTGAAAGSATVTATITYETAPGTEYSVTVNYPITVTAAPESP